MKSIKVWEVDDEAFYLTGEGFHKGKVVFSGYSNEGGTEKYSVKLKTGFDSPAYGGHTTTAEKVFKTLKELVDFYTKKV